MNTFCARQSGPDGFRHIRSEPQLCSESRVGTGNSSWGFEMTVKTPANMRTIIAFLKPLESNLNYPIDPIAEDMFSALDDALTAAPDDEAEQALLNDWLNARPHLKATAVLVPEHLAEAAFGNGCTLAAQGEIVRRYGGSLRRPSPRAGKQLSEVWCPAPIQLAAFAKSPGRRKPMATANISAGIRGRQK